MYKDKISAVYKIVNTVTGEFYIGSSVNVKRRWLNHKCPSTWGNNPNMLLYKAMKEYGLECFSFEILEEVDPESLKQEEQKFIELLKPTYNDINAKGWDVERYKNNNRKYRQSEEYKEAQKKYHNLPCLYNGETLTLCALRKRFSCAGVEHPTQEARKYLTNK